MSDHSLKFATSSYYSLAGAGISLRDNSSQTEWPYYKSKMGKGSYTLPGPQGQVPRPEMGAMALKCTGARMCVQVAEA